MSLTSAIHRMRSSLSVEAMDTNVDYTDADGERAMAHRWQQLEDHKKITTGIPGIDIVVGLVFLDYCAFLVQDGEPQGYVRFEFVFNNPQNRSWAGLVYTPHSYVRKSLRDKGYISSLYKWFLSSGRALLASYEHSANASRLWKGLVSKYPHQFLYHNNGRYERRSEGLQDPDTTVLVAPTQSLLNKLITNIE